MKIDRAGWLPGPWDDEPLDRLEFEHAGFPCLLNRGPQGAWCGYVGVPSEHPAAVYDDSDIEVHVHGGLTYGGDLPGGGVSELIWLGFDCNHSGDRAPRNFVRLPGTGPKEEKYRTMEYAKRETESLAEQLREMATWGLPCSYKTMIEHMTGVRNRASGRP